MDDAIKRNVSYNHFEISLYTTAIVHNIWIARETLVYQDDTGYG